MEEAADGLRCFLVCRGRASDGHPAKNDKSSGFIGFYPNAATLAVGIPSPLVLQASDFRQRECYGRREKMAEFEGRTAIQKATQLVTFS